MRPMQQYVDVKMAIAETEIFCVHQKDLIARGEEFGLDFLGPDADRLPVPVDRLRPAPARAPAHARRDGAAVREIRRAGHHELEPRAAPRPVSRL